MTSAVDRRALRTRVWRAAPQIAQALLSAGGRGARVTEMRVRVGVRGNVIALADWRGECPPPSHLHAAAERIAAVLGLASAQVTVADAWRWTDDATEAAWRDGIVLPPPPAASPPRLSPSEPARDVHRPSRPSGAPAHPSPGASPLAAGWA